MMFKWITQVNEAPHYIQFYPWTQFLLKSKDFIAENGIKLPLLEQTPSALMLLRSLKLLELVKSHAR